MAEKKKAEVQGVPRQSWMNRFLGVVEGVGNALPHPATGEVVQPVNLLSVEGLQRILTEMITNFTGFAPLGTVLWRCSALAWPRRAA